MQTWFQIKSTLCDNRVKRIPSNAFVFIIIRFAPGNNSPLIKRVFSSFAQTKPPNCCCLPDNNASTIGSCQQTLPSMIVFHASMSCNFFLLLNESHYFIHFNKQSQPLGPGEVSLNTLNIQSWSFGRLAASKVRLAFTSFIIFKLSQNFQHRALEMTIDLNWAIFFTRTSPRVVKNDAQTIAP